MSYYFRRYGLLGCFASSLIVAAIIFLYTRSSDWAMAATWIGGIISFFISYQINEREKLVVFDRLFRDFNDRYDGLRGELWNLINNIEDFPDADISVLMRYFNLCGEEYLYYSRGYIYPEVWQACKNGMIDVRRNEAVRKIWDQQLSTESYYGLKF